jgi:23S rRNA (cytidine1920-2'-O)/16S rRNA (cytidine1409-2'-O)-methyltransferase
MLFVRFPFQRRELLRWMWEHLPGYSVDVGQGLLHSRLVQDERVTLLEQVNGRHVHPQLFDNTALPTHGVTDVSFISLLEILPPLIKALASTSESWVVALLKPQFEAASFLTSEENEVFDGVVRDEALRQRIIEGTLVALSTSLLGWHLAGQCDSPLPGPAGNVEYVTLWKPDGS